MKKERKNLISAYAVFFETKGTGIIFCESRDIELSELRNGILIGQRFMDLPDGVCTMAVDFLVQSDRLYLAALYNNWRVYFYDFTNDFRNNIFEGADVSSNTLYLVKSNATYIVSGGGVFEVSDREKFTDLHFFPPYEKGTNPVIVEKDNETIWGIFQTKEGIEIWEYKF